MIRINIKHIFVLAGFIGSFLSCQDLKFGDDFLEKAPSNDVDIDVIYSNMHGQPFGVRMPHCIMV